MLGGDAKCRRKGRFSLSADLTHYGRQRKRATCASESERLAPATPAQVVRRGHELELSQSPPRATKLFAFSTAPAFHAIRPAELARWVERIYRCISTVRH